MSHYSVILKVRANDAEEAEYFVEDALDQSISCNDNKVGWDYVGDVTLITPELLQKEFNVQTYEELEKKLEQDRLNAYESLKTKVKHILQTSMTKQFSTKKDVKPPESYNEIIDTFIAILDEEIKNGSQLIYYVKCMERLQKCIQSPEDQYTNLQCPGNTFVILNTGEETEDQPTFYFDSDRHL